MLHFQFKGKGILIPVIAAVPAIVLCSLAALMQEFFFSHKFPDNVYFSITGAGLIISGFWNRRVHYDYFIDDKGEKHFVNQENQFMWLDMGVYSSVFWAFGGMMLLGGIGEMLLP